MSRDDSAFRRSARDMALSVMGFATLAFTAVVGLALG